MFIAKRTRIIALDFLSLPFKGNSRNVPLAVIFISHYITCLLVKACDGGILKSSKP
jgi:hypothetical protein